MGITLLDDDMSEFTQIKMNENGNDIDAGEFDGLLDSIDSASTSSQGGVRSMTP